MSTSQTKPIHVIYHSADFDGIFCREIARLDLGDRATYHGWNHGDAVPAIPTDAVLYILDLSVPELMDHPGLIWIDHHATAIAKYPASIPGYRIDGVAACRLAWQWFALNRPNWGGDMPDKAAFVDRVVFEPLAVRLAGEYDIWDKRDPRADLFQHGLRTQDLHWRLLLDCDDQAERYVDRLLDAGEILAYARRESIKRLLAEGAFEVEWEGLRWLAINAGGQSSDVYAMAEGSYDAGVAFCWSPKSGKWRFSLRALRPGLDLSLIAKNYGGGGHKAACGFEAKWLPFLGHEKMLVNALRLATQALERAEMVLKRVGMKATAEFVEREGGQARRALEIAVGMKCDATPHDSNSGA